MMVPHIEIVTVLTIILFAYPIFVYATKRQVLRDPNFSEITKVFNKAIVPQIVNAIILGISGFIINRMVYANGHGTMVTEIVVGTTMTYLIVGGFFLHSRVDNHQYY